MCLYARPDESARQLFARYMIFLLIFLLLLIFFLLLLLLSS